MIYFYQNSGMPLFALTAYAKNEAGDLTQKQRNDFRALTAMLVKAFTERKS